MTRASSSSGRGRRYRVRAMSIIEVIVAIGVVATGILGLLSVFIAGQQASTFGQNLSVATSYGRDVLEIIRSRGLCFQFGDTNGVPNLPPANSGLNDGPAERRPLNTTPPLAFTDLAVENVGQRTQFRRNITTVRVTNNATDYRSPLFQVTARIYWFDRGVEKDVKLVAVTRQPQ